MKHKPPDPVELGGSCTAEEEVDEKQVPVLRDDDQRVSGPDQAWWRKDDSESEGYAH